MIYLIGRLRFFRCGRYNKIWCRSIEHLLTKGGTQIWTSLNISHGTNMGFKRLLYVKWWHVVLYPLCSTDFWRGSKVLHLNVRRWCWQNLESWSVLFLSKFWRHPWHHGIERSRNGVAVEWLTIQFLKLPWTSYLTQIKWIMGIICC